MISNGSFQFVAYLINGKHDVNLIAVNWEKASLKLEYDEMRKNIGDIGLAAAEFIDFMVNQMKTMDLYLI